METGGRFRRDGYLPGSSVLTAAEAAEALEGYRAFQRRARQVFGQEQRFKAHLLVGWLDAILRHPAILARVAAILGPDLLCWSTDFFEKAPGSEDHVSFHQDCTYAGLEPISGIVNCWLALTPSTIASGCLQVLPGSHRLGQLIHDTDDDPDNMLFYGQAARLPEDASPIPLELSPGQMSLHHMGLVHGSGPNRSSSPRIGVVLRYLRPEVRQIKGPDSATLVAGEDRFGHFEHEPRPAEDWSPQAIAAFSAALTRPSALG